MLKKFLNNLSKYSTQYRFDFNNNHQDFLIEKNHSIKKNLPSKLKKINSGFSLIEVSIVILIIGVLISGITTFSRLVKQMKLTSIKQFTTSSPVPTIKGLSLWMETSLDGSVSGVINPLSPDDNEKITSWNDINPQNSARVFATQTTDSLRPVYTTIGTINELPAVKFDGAQYLSSLKSSGGNIPLAQGDDSFTMFAVWQTNTNSSFQAIIDQTALSEINGARAGMLLASGTYGFCGQGNDNWNCQQYFPKTPYISAITFADNGTTKIFTNSTTANCITTLNPSIQNISDQGFFIGVKGGNTVYERMNGIIQEIIIYDRVLSDDELKDIFKYLSKKFAIRIS